VFDLGVGKPSSIQTVKQANPVPNQPVKLGAPARILSVVRVCFQTLASPASVGLQDPKSGAIDRGNYRLASDRFSDISGSSIFHLSNVAVANSNFGAAAYRNVGPVIMGLLVIFTSGAATTTVV
jgi:hypothetical protein